MSIEKHNYTMLHKTLYYLITHLNVYRSETKV